jgi:hypothetical protein
MTARAIRTLVSLAQCAQPATKACQQFLLVCGLSLRHCTTFKPTGKQKRAPD